MVHNTSKGILTRLAFERDCDSKGITGMNNAKKFIDSNLKATFFFASHKSIESYTYFFSQDNK